MIIGTCFHGQNVKIHKKDKIVTLSIPKFVNLHNLNAQEELRISGIFFATLLAKILIDYRKGDFLSLSKMKFIKDEKDKKITNNPHMSFKQKITLLITCK